MRLSKYWDIEDIFFGALFGSVIGAYVNKLPFQYILLLVGFFAIFPSALRKASTMSDNIVRWVIVVSGIWLVLFFVDLLTTSIITRLESFVAFFIFLGWVASVYFRVKR